MNSALRSRLKHAKKKTPTGNRMAAKTKLLRTKLLTSAAGRKAAKIKASR